MIRVFLLSLLLSLGITPLAFAASASCLEDREAQVVQQDFEWKSDHSQYRQLDFCDVGNLTRKTVSVLVTLSKLRFQPLPIKSLSLNVLPEIPYEYFKARVRRIVFEARNSSACPVEYQNGVAVSWLSAFVTHEDRTMHICELAGRLEHYDFAQLMIHEARHLDGKEFDHIRCTRGHFATSSAAACDSHLEDLGSYAVGIEFNLKLSFSPLVNPFARRTARRQALKDLSTRFNVLPLDIKEGALLQNFDGTLSFFDGSSLQRVQPLRPHQSIHKNSDSSVAKRPRPKNSQSLLVRHFELPLLYNLSQKVAANTVHYVYPFESTENPPLPDLEEPLRNLLSKNPNAKLLDVFHRPAFTCYLLSTKLFCQTSSGSSQEIEFVRLRPMRLLSTSSSIVSTPENVSVLDQDGAVYSLPKKFETGQPTNETELVAKPFLLNAVRIDAWTGLGKSSYDILVLNQSGEVKGLSSTSNSLKTLPALQGLKFKDMISPYLYSPKLQEL